MNYNIGDKVVIVKAYGGMSSVGDIVEIVDITEDGAVGVRFDNKAFDRHSCNGHCKYGYGWYFTRDCIMHISDIEDIPFEPADKGDVCGISGEPAVYKIGKLRVSEKYKYSVAKCAECGEWYYIKDINSCDNKYMCTDCIKEHGWFVCEDCGEIIKDASDIRVANEGLNDERTICHSCASTYQYFKCDDCGKLYRKNHLWNSGGGIQICDFCEDNWISCYECGAPVRRVASNMFDGKYYCNNHNPSYVNIHNYSFKPTPHFKGTGDLYMGVELEVDSGDNYDDCKACAGEIKNDNIYCKRDGSLDCGFEIVTHPCTLDYHINELGWDSVSRKAGSWGFSSHNAGTCGLHIHVNRTFFGDSKTDQDYAISRVILFVQKFWDYLVKFSRRDRVALEEWSNAPSCKIERLDSRNTAIDKVRGESSAGRYKAVNLSNRNTVEFRIFRGTLKTSTIFATLQFVDGVCRFCKDNDLTTIYDMTWDDVIASGYFEADELREYLVSRGLGSTSGRVVEF